MKGRRRNRYDGDRIKMRSIVLSTLGLTGLGRCLIGSVADRVARLAPCPVFFNPICETPISRAVLSAAVLRFKYKSKGRC
jgi:hypothetical protein